jgi:hypothetical protein
MSKAPRLVSYDQIFPVLPHPIPYRQLVRMSGTRFPACVRPAGFKSPPLWLEQDVVGWVKDRYSTLLPDFCRRLEEEGIAARPFSRGSV